MKLQRTLVIGDIHNGLKSFKQVCERARVDFNKDKMIFLGDYVDGWSEGAELIEHLINIKESSEIEHIFLNGNHCSWTREYLEYGSTPEIWVSQGGQATIDSYIRTGFYNKESHKKFFRELHNYYIDDKNRGFVHGGFISKQGLGNEQDMSTYYWDRSLWGIAMSLRSQDNVSKNSKLKQHKEIYIGHTDTMNYKCKLHYPEFQIKEQTNKSGHIHVPMNRCNVWNLDTGGGMYGKLTIMDIDTKEFWQSDFVSKLYD